MLHRCLGTVVLLSCFATATAASADPLDEPIGTRWTGQRTWDVAAERGYSDFVAAIGRAAAAGKCRRLYECLNDPAINPLMPAGAKPLRMRSDCADVPYVLRGYFAWVHDLPFVWTEKMTGKGRDSRYYKEARPVGRRSFRDHKTPRRLFEKIGGEVNSGWFRSAPDVEETDTYPVRVTRGAIRPGTMFYDPNGHVLVVWSIAEGGDVLFFDGHPDGSLTHTRLSDKQAVGGVRQGGGFRNFRPLSWDGQRAHYTANALLADFDPVAHGDRSRHRIAGQKAPYDVWVRSLLVAPSAPRARQKSRGSIWGRAWGPLSSGVGAP